MLTTRLLEIGGPRNFGALFDRSARTPSSTGLSARSPVASTRRTSGRLAGVLLPTPITTCRYWHRSLNPKKLIDVGFSCLGPRMTMSRTVRLYKLPDAPLTPGFRQMELLKFKPGDGQLYYYLYNYHIRNGIKPCELGLVLL